MLSTFTASSHRPTLGKPGMGSPGLLLLGTFLGTLRLGNHGFLLLSTLLGTFLGTLSGHCYPMTIATTTHPNPSRTNPTPPHAESDRLVFTVAEAGELLGISRAFAYELVARGELPVIRLGRRRLIPKRALLELVGMDSHRQPRIGLGHSPRRWPWVGPPLHRPPGAAAYHPLTPAKSPHRLGRLTAIGSSAK